MLCAAPSRARSVKRPSRPCGSAREKSGGPSARPANARRRAERRDLCYTARVPKTLRASAISSPRGRRCGRERTGADGRLTLWLAATRLDIPKCRSSDGRARTDGSHLGLPRAPGRRAGHPQHPHIPKHPQVSILATTRALTCDLTSFRFLPTYLRLTSDLLKTFRLTSDLFPTYLRLTSDLLPTYLRLSDLLPTYLRLTSDFLPTSFRLTSDLLPTLLKTFRLTSDLPPTYLRLPSDFLPTYFRLTSDLLPTYLKTFRLTSDLLPTYFRLTSDLLPTYFRLTS